MWNNTESDYKTREKPDLHDCKSNGFYSLDENVNAPTNIPYVGSDNELIGEMAAQASFIQVCQDITRQNCIIRSVHVRRDLYAVVFDFQKGESRQERRDILRQAASLLAHNSDRYLAAEVLIGVSDAPDFGSNASECWNGALDALEESFYGNQTICYAWKVQPSRDVIPQTAREFCDHIGEYMQRKDGNSIRNGYQESLKAFQTEHTRSQLVKEWLMQADRKAGISIRPIPQHFSDLEGLEQAYLAFCEELLPDAERYSDAVAQTVRFLQKNFIHNISLNDAADEVHLNAAYLSFIFHKETGITFSEYLTSCRINHAKGLLMRSRMKVKEVGDQSGYHDNRHFCKIFKRVTGMTPQEYRKNSTAK